MAKFKVCHACKKSSKTLIQGAKVVEQGLEVTQTASLFTLCIPCLLGAVRSDLPDVIAALPPSVFEVVA
jgi:hypothetical protein